MPHLSCRLPSLQGYRQSFRNGKNKECPTYNGREYAGDTA
jgi:hypothetical protein